ncbi:MAG: radical SAM protein [Acidimicrobiales bacterium]
MGTPPPDLRWRLADGPEAAADPQGALFDEVVERHVGKGEYGGMEFLHVNARTVINEVPKASRMPFRHTINAYRGCSHACNYCLAPETPVLLAEGRTRPIADLRVGDEVVGTERVGQYRRFVPTPVVAHWATVKPAYRITLENGTELVASADHRFLTERGWKHVTGTEQGRGRRPHLTRGNALLGIGTFAAGPVESADYQRGYVCGMVRGDAHLGHYAYQRRGRPNARHTFRPALADLEPLTRARRYLENERISTTEFLFAAGDERRRPMVAIRTQARVAVEGIETLIRWPAQPSTDWFRGFLAGIYDAEGHLGGAVRICNGDPTLLGWIERSFGALGFRCLREPARGNGVTDVRLLGGLGEVLRFILTVDPATTRKRVITGRALKGSGRRRVVAVDRLGLDLPMFDITTGTGDFIADGVVSHNCFARPTHEYLGMNIGEDFDRRIVVKVNAVERVRAELAPSRWRGDHIAMGTNTDPYQRCEGKYRLTQGIVGELAAARNPFSILTKSTLILRDLSLLAEAAAVTEVRANFSIGTLDEEVWRLTEPGTPHPRHRIEAVAKLNAAGVPCGVLVAPILPGLSDRPEQLEAVVKACVDAGAMSITPLLLHLRAGVKEHYLSWLAEARPDLTAEYARLYPRAYASKATQQAVSRQVAAMVARHGGRTVPASFTRAVRPRPAADAAAAPRVDAADVRQLALDM